MLFDGFVDEVMCASVSSEIPSQGIRLAVNCALTTPDKALGIAEYLKAIATLFWMSVDMGISD